MNRTVCTSYVPVFLGGAAFRHALKYYLLYGLHSHVFDHYVSPATLLTPFLHLHKVKKTPYYQPLFWRLSAFAKEHPEQICLLIPTTPPFTEFVRQHKTELEPLFILSDPQLSNISFFNEERGTT